MDGAATVRVAVAPERASMYQRYLELCGSRFILLTGLLPWVLFAKIVHGGREEHEWEHTLAPQEDRLAAVV